MDSLRKLNTKLLAEIAELRKENAKIPELREKLQRFAEVEAENAKLRQIIEENARRETENNELKSRLENRVAMLEQGSLVAGQSQHDNSSNNNSSNFNSVAEHHEKSLEDVCSSKQDRATDDFSPKEPANVPDSAHSLAPQIKNQEKLLENREMDAFLIETHKKSISDEIRR
ncbi:7515_t:CDS:2 [Gigaspora rosea]|nr:7515_t:CDS:2 [Gigaspora rosea]